MWRAQVLLREARGTRVRRWSHRQRDCGRDLGKAAEVRKVGEFGCTGCGAQITARGKIDQYGQRRAGLGIELGGLPAMLRDPASGGRGSELSLHGR